MYEYVESFGVWVAQSARAVPAELRSLRVATFNVWFDAFECDRRREAVLAILRRELPDIIALEEVTNGFLAALLETPWVRAEYAVSRTRLDAAVKYDVVMLCRLKGARFTAHTLTSEMGRKLHALELETTAGPLTVAGIHLESMQQMTPTRLTQIDECLPLLCRSDNAVWLGDFNASPASEEDSRIRAAFRDAWEELAKEPGYTRDTTANAMLAKLKADRHQRIDRVFVRSEQFVPTAIRMLGTEPIEGTDGKVFPSDHFGLVADLTCRLAEQEQQAWFEDRASATGE